MTKLFINIQFPNKISWMIWIRMMTNTCMGLEPSILKKLKVKTFLHAKPDTCNEMDLI